MKFSFLTDATASLPIAADGPLLEGRLRRPEGGDANDWAWHDLHSYTSAISRLAGSL
jgi:hypothetical protein